MLGNFKKKLSLGVAGVLARGGMSAVTHRQTHTCTHKDTHTLAHREIHTHDLTYRGPVSNPFVSIRRSSKARKYSFTHTSLNLAEHTLSEMCQSNTWQPGVFVCVGGCGWGSVKFL